MQNSRFFIYRTILYLSSLVWLANGLFFKILDFIPRHQQIVGEILGSAYAKFFTLSIGVGEVFIALWILSLWKSRLCVLVQIGLIISMNIMEFFLVPEMLLFGKMNLVYAILFCSLLYLNEFKIKRNA
jgi:hypothetical protein